MFSVLKFIWLVFKAFPALLNVDKNALANVPDPTKYLAMIMLSCFWCLAFGLFFGEVLNIAPNMVGHVAIVTMAFVTWFTFRNFTSSDTRGIDYLRMPDRSSRCDELTDEQRLAYASRADEILGNNKSSLVQSKAEYYYGA